MSVLGNICSTPTGSKRRVACSGPSGRAGAHPAAHAATGPGDRRHGARAHPCGTADEARRWCEEALGVARAVDSAEVEADILVTLGIVAQYDDPAKARTLYAAGRARAADAGNLEIELRALLNLGWLEFALGKPGTRPCRVRRRRRAGPAGRPWLVRLGITHTSRTVLVRFEAGDWDECERLAGVIPDLVTTLAVAELALRASCGGRPRARDGNQAPARPRRPGRPGHQRRCRGRRSRGRPGHPAG